MSKFVTWLYSSTYCNLEVKEKADKKADKADNRGKADKADKRGKANKPAQGGFNKYEDEIAR